MRRYASFASTRSNRYIGSSESNGDLPLRSRSHITSSFWIPRYLVTDSSVEHELLQEGKISSAGTSLSRPEIEALLAERFPRRPYCLVEDWLLFHVDEPPESLARVRSAGLQPMFLYSHCVTYDSQGRFPPGGWVLRIPRHPATQSALIWPGIPGPSGHLFHGHPAGQSERSDAGVALLVRVGWRRQFLRPFAH